MVIREPWKGNNGADGIFSNLSYGGMKDGSEGIKVEAKILEVSQEMVHYQVGKRVWICKLF